MVEFKDNQTVLIGGISDAGFSKEWLHRLELSGAKHLTAVLIESNEEVFYGDISRLVYNGQIDQLIISHSGSLLDNLEELLEKDGKNPEDAESYLENIKVSIYPMDVLAQKIQAGANGMKGIVVDPELMRYVTDNPDFESTVQHSDELGDFIVEEAIRGDVGIIQASNADKYGNVNWDTTQFNSADVARASDTVLVEVENLVDELDVDNIGLEHIWVSEVVYPVEEGQFEVLSDFKKVVTPLNEELSFNRDKLKERIAEKALDYIDEGSVVNLGYGIPSFFMIEGVAQKAEVQMESAVLGVSDTEGTVTGHNDPGGQLVNLSHGGAVSKTVLDSFSMINNGKIDYTVLGAFEVAANGDLANWAVSENDKAGVGGAVALVNGAKNVIITMIEHKRNGERKLKDELTLPVTGRGVVSLVVTDKGVYRPEDGEFKVLEQYDEETKEWTKL